MDIESSGEYNPENVNPEIPTQSSEEVEIKESATPTPDQLPAEESSHEKSESLSFSGET